MWVPTPEVINRITNWLGFLLFIFEPIRAYLAAQPFQWQTFAICVGGAILAYFTGKGSLSLKRMMVTKKLL